MRINYFSPVRLTLALLPGLIERGGRIVNLSSVAARLGPPIEASYAASKAAITAFSECMAVDLRDTDVQVHIVNPGVIDTELFHLPDNETGFHSDGRRAAGRGDRGAGARDARRGHDRGLRAGVVRRVVAGKFNDPDAFIAGTKAYATQVESAR